MLKAYHKLQSLSNEICFWGSHKSVLIFQIPVKHYTTTIVVFVSMFVIDSLIHVCFVIRKSFMEWVICSKTLSKHFLTYIFMVLKYFFDLN